MLNNWGFPHQILGNYNMKNIIINERQLRLISEQSSTSLGGLKTILNTTDPEDEINFGTLTVYNKNNRPVKIRFTAKVPIKGLSDVNIVKLETNNDGSISIQTYRGLKKTFNKEIVDKLVNFINNDKVKEYPNIAPELGTLNVKKL